MNYQVIARRFRPQTFKEILGQDAIVTTLKNAIKLKRLAHAYLFCGPRGTGKTTLARVFAKALNCAQPSAEGEPCNQCNSCREITQSNSFDVLEIDGASHRGIDDIRQINETVSYATASGKYKIYLIDEVHMLTKEAFNALLKTLEEPPPKVLFFFATTEPHKVPATILSRCQRFNLNRIPASQIAKKLQRIAQELHVHIENDALERLTWIAEGGLRDAESLFDQIIAFNEGPITLNAISAVLGVMPKEVLFQLDRAGKEGNLAMAFEVAHQLYSQGKDIGQFIDDLTEHFRQLLLIKIGGKQNPHLTISDEEREQYAASAQLYTQEQCLVIIDLITQSTQQHVTWSRVALEALLLKILRIHQRVSLDVLLNRLAELEKKVSSPAIPKQAPSTPITQPLQQKTAKTEETSSLTEDPTPTAAELGKSAPIELGARPTEEAKQVTMQQQSRYDTILQFASIELEGKLQKKSLGR